MIGPHHNFKIPPAIETFKVTKQEGVTRRYRYRVQGVDFSKRYLRSLEAFKFRYSKNMDASDIARVEAEWELKLVKEEFNVN